MRVHGSILVALVACWIVAEIGLGFLGVTVRGCCGSPLGFELEHEAALVAGVVALVCAWIGRRVLRATHRFALPLARTVPLIAAGAMLGLSLEALICPFCCCGGAPRPPLPSVWSAWHHYAVQAFAMLVAAVGLLRVRVVSQR